MKKQTFIVNEEDTLINTILSFKKDLSKKTIKNYVTHKMVMVNNNVITNTNYQVHKNDGKRCCCYEFGSLLYN